MEFGLGLGHLATQTLTHTRLRRICMEETEGKKYGLMGEWWAMVYKSFIANIKSTISRQIGLRLLKPLSGA